jgi:hypothetical protein
MQLQLHSEWPHFMPLGMRPTFGTRKSLFSLSGFSVLKLTLCWTVLRLTFAPNLRNEISLQDQRPEFVLYILICKKFRRHGAKRKGGSGMRPAQPFLALDWGSRHHRGCTVVSMSSFVIDSLITNFWILPVTVVGYSSTNRT